MRTLYLGDEPRHRDPGLPRRGAGEPARGDAGAVPGGRVPRAGEVRLPQRRRRGAGPPALRRAAPSSASTRTRPATWSRPTRSPRCPTTCPAARAVLAGTVETAVNAVWDAAPQIGDRIAVVGAGMVGCCVARCSPASRRAGAARRRRPGAATVAAALGVDFARPRTPRGGCDLVVHASATEAGLPASLELLAPGGHGRRAELVRRPAGQRAAGRVVPLAPPDDALQPGRQVAPARRAGRTYADRLALASTCSPIRRSTR